MEDRLVMKRGMKFSGKVGGVFDYYAVFDGHGGEFTAKWLAEHFHGIVQKKIQDVAADAGPGVMMKALNEAFKQADEDLRKQMTRGGD